MTNQKYTNKQQTDFVDLAVEVGIARAMRELEYPSSWITGKKWCDARGIDITVDSLKAASTAAREWYKDEQIIRVAEAGIQRVFDDLQEKSLNADEQKKLSEAFQKHANTWLALKGKTQSISETRTVGEMDLEIKKLINTMEEDNIKQEASLK